VEETEEGISRGERRPGRRAGGSLFLRGGKVVIEPVRREKAAAAAEA
jgi:hypothetical protein